jgi:hypothetical protein
MCDRKRLILGVTKSMMSWTGPSGVRVAASCTSSARLALKNNIHSRATHYTHSQSAYGRVVSVIRDRYGTLLQDLRA